MFALHFYLIGYYNYTYILYYILTNNYTDSNQSHAYQIKTDLYCPLSCALRAHERWLKKAHALKCARFLSE